jgi:beta-galactosidase
VGSETFHGDVVRNLRAMERLPYLIGDFTWSAWDYLGEAGCGAWSYGDKDTAFQKSYPWLLANQGAIDICGQPNAELFLAQAAWGRATETPLIAVQPLGQGAKASRAIWRFSNAIPSWSWKGSDGERATVEVYCDAPVVELRLNGRSISRKRPRGCICRWSVPYEPGELRVTALTARGEELGHTTLRSADHAQVCLIPEQNEAHTGELVFVDVLVADDEGIVEHNDDRLLMASAEGCELLAFGSARPRTEERYDTGRHTTYFGHAQAILRMGEADATLVIEDADDETRLTIRHITDEA